MENTNSQVEVVEETAVVKKKEITYASSIEQMLVEDLIRIDLKESDIELNNRIVVQHRDKIANRDCFNATAKKVLITDENGRRIVINNHDEIRRQQLKNSGKLNVPAITQNAGLITEDEVDFD